METNTVSSTPTIKTLAVAVLGAGVNGMRSVPTVNAKGKHTGVKISVGEQGSFKDIRAALQTADPTLKGNALTKKVNEIFHGEKALRTELATIMVSRLAAEDVLFDTGSITNRGATLRFKKPADAVARGAKLKKAMETLAEANGIDPAKIAEFLATNAKKEEKSIEVASTVTQAPA